MAITGFICHDDYLGKTAKLSDEEVGRLFRACMTYHATGELLELSGRESIAFDFIREDIDKAEEAYRAKCEINRQNRQQGMGRAKTGVKDREQPLTVVEKPERKRFTPPTVEEVRAYCNERKNHVSPEAFVAFYESKGWMIGKNKMTNWRRAVITWEQRDSGNNGSSGKPAKVVTAQQYDQRKYENHDDDVLNAFMAK